MTGATLKRPLSAAEKQLVEQYHNLIYRVMNDTHLYGDAASDLYGEAALALILAAQRYLSDDSLQKYCFTTIAYSRIRCALLHEVRKLTKCPQMESLDAELATGGTLYDAVPNQASVDPADIAAAQGKPSLLHLVRSHKRLHTVPLPYKEAA